MSAAPGVYRRAWRRPTPPRQRRWVPSKLTTSLGSSYLGLSLPLSLGLVVTGSAAPAAPSLNLLTDPNFIPHLVYPHIK